MLKILGSMLCKDCVACRDAYDRQNIAYKFYDIADDLGYLKEFLSYRDTLPAFDDCKREGTIGIPCIITEDGTVSLDWESYVSQADA